MPKIQANLSGTRSIEVTDAHLSTLHRYQLLRSLPGCTGYVDEQTLDRLRLSVRSLLASGASTDEQLLNLCLDVIYHPHMKAVALRHLMQLYDQWLERQPDGDPLAG